MKRTAKGRYSGLPGEYYFKLKSTANTAAKRARDKGYKASVSKWGNIWLVKVS